ncbi:MAG: efflux RND transporter periplasmic adaptor subunit [Bacillota bacterium]|nr:efflux RND transporter periplasmic adaptor subunit [Bacillota bacterium]
MKKYIILGVTLIAFLGIIVFIGSTVKSSIPTITLTKITSSEIDNTVTSNGKVEFGNAYNIRATGNMQVSEILVREGEKVSKGQAIVILTEYNTSQHNQTTNLSQQDLYNAIKNRDYSVLKNYNTSSLQSVNAIPQGTIVTVYAPISGVISNIHVSVNDIVAKGSLLLSISSNAQLQVRMSVSESKIAEIKVGQSVEISGAGLLHIYHGNVMQIGNVAKQTTTTLGKDTIVEVVVSIKNPGSDIKSGFNTKCVVTTSKIKNALLVPYDCVDADDDGNEFVYVYNNGTASKKMIKTGIECDSGFQVISGITKNDSIISEVDKVNNDETVKVTDSVVSR